ncbi:pyridoxal-phosphate dependent enzyme [Sedimentibacter sp.]|uniref:pyridoxal-phosphate dependent enzyme n=1 Tax=Sedimentibacter sp. TaxID=1960295 RepID=UPI0028972199|nr:pyridoxal-phosphate dependent enzyme [Sedimentibacter sp.]
MINTGKTPLMRSKKLEKALGVEEIYLKLEGANPYGNKYDRISETLVKDAIVRKRSTLLVDGPSDYIKSIINYSEKYDIDIRVSLFKNEQWKKSLFQNMSFADFRHSKTNNKHELIEKYCKENNCYNASNSYGNKHLSIVSLQKIGEEIAERLGDNISTVFTQLSNGYTVSGLYNGFVNKWVEGEINKYPQIFSCTIPHGNTIYNDYKKNLELNDISIDDFNVRANKYTKNLFADDGALLEEALNAINDTDGKIIPVDEALLMESVNFLRKQEHIYLTSQEGYSFAGFYKLVNEGKIKNGKHVIILNNGKSDLELIRVENFKEYSKETLTKWTKEWLQDYSDTLDETEEAIEFAMRNGFIVIALRNNVPQGIGVVVNLGFEKVIPTYHLVYIGTKEGNKGRGIASELLNYLIETTEGRLSLHVDLENKRARTLYQKLGFKTSYYRMIYNNIK